MNATEAKVFISYAREDESAAWFIEGELKGCGISTWVDHEGVRGGAWPERLNEALEWCNTVVLVWSVYAANSKWVKREWTTALALEKQIIPALLDGNRVPPLLAAMNWVDMMLPQKAKFEIVREIEGRDVRMPADFADIRQPSNLSLRPSPNKRLSRSDVTEMIVRYDYFCSGKFNVPWKNERASGVSHDYELESKNTVIDNTTGLKWLRTSTFGYQANLIVNGRSEPIDTAGMKLSYHDLSGFIEQINNAFIGGTNKWRLPTLEEAMSLLEPRKQRGLHIDPIFSEDISMWTADQENESKVWIVYFNNGTCLSLDLFYDVHPVRAVCSWRTP